MGKEFLLLTEAGEAILTEGLEPILLEGGGAGGLFGIKVSKPGVDVKTANAKDLVLTSLLASLKIKQIGSGTLSITGGSGSTLVTIQHNLGYIPIVIAYCDTLPDGSKQEFLSSNIKWVTDLDEASPFISEITATSLTIEVWGNDGNYEYGYMVLADPFQEA